MNQISLYNKSTDSKLSIEAEELTRSRNIKIPKDGSFLLTNKTRLTEELADKYTVGPTGDFQELEEAVRVLCNMKEYSSRQGDVIVELQEDYLFKSYTQFGMNAGFIIVRHKSPSMQLRVDPTINLNRGIFYVDQGAISPRFTQITMNITSTGRQLFTVLSHSVLTFHACTFNFDYQDREGTETRSPLFLIYNSATLVITSTVINMSINKNNNTMINSGRRSIRWFSRCCENSDAHFNNVKINIEDKSNIEDSSITTAIICNTNSDVVFATGLIKYSTEHGGFVLVSAQTNGRIYIGSNLTLTGNSNFNSGNQKSTLIDANSLGSITCGNITLKDCGTISNPIRYSFRVVTGGMINITNYKNDNSHVTDEANITVNTLTRNGVIYK